MTLIRWILSLGLWIAAAPLATADAFTLGPELWDRPRTGRAVLGEPSVNRAVNAYLARPDARLVIRHPPGAVPVLQAEELRAWLIALAVEPEHVTLRSDLEPNTMLLIEVVLKR